MIRISSQAHQSLILTGNQNGTTIVVEPHATLNLFQIWLNCSPSPPETCRLTLMAGAKVTLSQFILGAKNSHFTLKTSLAKSAQLDARQLILLKNDDNLKFNFSATQSGKESKSHFLAFACLDGAATLKSQLATTFMSGASGADGREYQKVLFFSPHAHCRIIPQIASLEADIQGKHGLSIGKLFKTETNYLRARGLTLAAIRKLVLEGEVRALITRFDSPALHARIEKAARSW